MTGNIIWIAITNIKRHKLTTLFYFLMCMVLATGIFSTFISKTIINLPEAGPLKNFFIMSSSMTLFVSIVILIGLSYFQIINRKTEIAIYRIFGVRKSDLFSMFSIENIIITSVASLGGIIITSITIFGFQNALVKALVDIYREYTRIIIISAARTLFTTLLTNFLISFTVFTINSHKEIEKLIRGVF